MSPTGQTSEKNQERSTGPRTNRTRDITMKKDNWFLSLINSSFVVTVIGGLILGYITNEWQQIDVANSIAKETRKQQYLSKKDVLSEFSEIIPGSLFSLQRYKQREFWIEKYVKSKNDNFISPDNRNFNETLKIYEKEQEEYFTKRLPIPVLSEIRGTFTNEEIGTSSSNLIELFASAIDSTSMKEFKKYYSMIDEKYFSLITLLSKEINEYEK